jgi:hypothetical protein
MEGVGRGQRVVCDALIERRCRRRKRGKKNCEEAVRGLFSAEV